MSVAGLAEPKPPKAAKGFTFTGSSIFLADGGESTCEDSRKGEGRVGMLIAAGTGTLSSLLTAAAAGEGTGGGTGKEKADLGVFLSILVASKTKPPVTGVEEEGRFLADSGVPRTLPPNEKPLAGGAGGASFLDSAAGFGLIGVGIELKEKPAKGTGLEEGSALPKDTVGLAELSVLELSLSILVRSVLYFSRMVDSALCKSTNGSWLINFCRVSSTETLSPRREMNGLS